MEIPPVLRERYTRLFHFYDRNSDGVHTLRDDFNPVARLISRRWHGRLAPFPDLLKLLLTTYQHENSRRDQDGNGIVDLAEFISSHQKVLDAFHASPAHARLFIERAAGGFFDVLDLDRDGFLQLDDLCAFAEAYGHDPQGIAENLAAMLSELGLPSDRLPRQAFLALVEQFWFDPTPTTPGRHLFDGISLA